MAPCRSRGMTIPAGVLMAALVLAADAAEIEDQAAALYDGKGKGNGVATSLAPPNC